MKEINAKIYYMNIYEETNIMLKEATVKNRPCVYELLKNIKINNS